MTDLKIKFSEQYFKMPLIMPFKAKLLQCIRVKYDDLSPEFKFYDVVHENGMYPLPKGDLILLLLVTKNTSQPIMFTTMRRYTPDKLLYYKSKEGYTFDIVRGEI